MTMRVNAKGEASATPRAARIVVVLGRRRKVALRELVDRAWRERVPLVIINLGFPLTPSQQAIVDGALEAAATGAIALDAMIAYDARQAAAFLHEGDEVIYAASRGERTEVQSALTP